MRHNFRIPGLSGGRAGQWALREVSAGVRAGRQPAADELFPPEDLRRALHGQFREVRLGAVRELSGPEWLHHQDPVRASASRRQLEWRAGLEDDQAVKDAIHGHLGGPGNAPRPRARR